MGDLRQDLTAAIKARDRVAVAALRSALAAIENAAAVPASDTLDTTQGNEHFAGATAGLGAAEADRRALTPADVRAIIAAEIHGRTTAAEEYERLGRTDQASALRAEADVLRPHVE